MTGYIVEFKEINKEEEDKKAQRRLLLSEAEEKEPEGDDNWQKVFKKICRSMNQRLITVAFLMVYLSLCRQRTLRSEEPSLW